jgi:hypothetical protein
VSSPRTNDAWRLLGALTLSLLIAMAFPLTAGAAEQVRTDPGDLPGYTVTAEGAPLSMLLYEEVIPVPVDPGEPHGEGSLSYTNSKLETGPQARALASSFWPGPAVGDGFATLCDQVTNNPQAPKDMRQECNQNYEIKADHSYPSNQEPQSKEAGPTGAGMLASALGLDVFARASSAESPNEEAFALGNARSRSESTVAKGKAVATTVASAEDISLGGGVITIENVKTVVEATTTSTKGATTGTTEVSGLVIGGQGYQIDEKGLRPVAEGKPQDSEAEFPAFPGRKELRENTGIDVELVKHTTTVNGADASRTAGGLRISIDSAVLKDAVTSNVPVDDILGQLPEETDDITIQLVPLLQLAPQIDFVFGRGEVRAAGVEGIDFDFDFPGPPAPPVPPGGETTTGGTSTPPSVGSGTTTTGGGSAAPPAIAPADSGTGGPAVPSAQPPVAASQAAATAPAAAALPPLFAGLPPGLVAAAFVLAALGGRGLVGLTGVAMTGLTGAICDRGVPRKIPDLRAQG